MRKAVVKENNKEIRRCAPCFKCRICSGKCFGIEIGDIKEIPQILVIFIMP